MSIAIPWQITRVLVSAPAIGVLLLRIAEDNNRVDLSHACRSDGVGSVVHHLVLLASSRQGLSYFADTIVGFCWTNDVLAS